MAYKQKFKDSIITDAGRKMILAVDAGEGTLVYTKTVLTSQSMTNADGTPLADEDIRAITTLKDEERTVQPSVQPITDNTITVNAQFSNKDLNQDIDFNSVAWFARVDADGKQGQEQIIAITPNTQTWTLAAGAPDHRSSETISIDLDMAISNAANVNMTVRENGYVTDADFNVFITKIQDQMDKKLADAGAVKSVSINNGTPVQPDANKNVNLNIDAYTKADADAKFASKAEINSSTSGKANVQDVYNKTDADSKFATKQDISSANTSLSQSISTKADASNVYSKADSDGKFETITDATTHHTDFDNRLKFLEQNAVIGKRFKLSDEAAAEAWQNKYPNYLAIVEK